MRSTLLLYAASWPIRGDLAILGAALFLAFAVYGLILVAYAEPKSQADESRPEEGPGGTRAGGLSIRALVTILGLALGCVVLTLSGC